ncbi:NfeD family protein [Aquitalea magnusonii]|uniref:Membrane protein implicated in regulation of membrane protease activity n=1 Tax=Aquitalea magnusonii TaxID=332411 RepID=A0A318JJV6_9NEIS|nr:NfeD family protein [Aquitalea magnusonii]PXX48307.1 membrane protein implicated in regulation of membrane protease activity [Aquitalea magnusonii]
MTHTIWLVAALLALIAEFMSGTFYLLVLALALAMAGLGSLAGASEVLCWLLASLSGSIGVGCVARWRARQRRGRPTTTAADDPDLGQTVRISTLLDGGLARVHYRGTEWQARLSGDGPWQAGMQAYIHGRDGNVLILSLKQTETR